MSLNLVLSWSLVRQYQDMPKCFSNISICLQGKGVKMIQTIIFPPKYIFEIYKVNAALDTTTCCRLQPSIFWVFQYIILIFLAKNTNRTGGMLEDFLTWELFVSPYTYIFCALCRLSFCYQLPMSCNALACNTIETFFSVKCTPLGARLGEQLFQFLPFASCMNQNNTPIF